MKAKVKKPTFAFAPSMLDARGKVLYINVAYRELMLQLTAQLCISVDDLACVLQGVANGIVDFDCSDTFYSNLETDKRLMLEHIKTMKENFEKEYNYL